MEAAITAIKPGVSTDQIARLWPTAQDIGLPDEKTAFGLQFGHGLGLAPARAADHQQAVLA